MSLTAVMDALVGLEETISPGVLRVYRWQPANIEPPCVYNWIIPSDAKVAATMTVEDQIQMAVRIIPKPQDLDEQTAALEQYWDLARDTIDADLVEPSKSRLAGTCSQAQRTRIRNIVAEFNRIEYLGLELVIQITQQRIFSPS